MYLTYTYLSVLFKDKDFMIVNVKISAKAIKNLKRAPKYIQEKFTAWVIAVNKSGLENTKRCLGWHDEQLLGKRSGQRSIRLNKQWRAIYLINKNNEIKFIEIIEVTPHDY